MNPNGKTATKYKAWKTKISPEAGSKLMALQIKRFGNCLEYQFDDNYFWVPDIESQIHSTANQTKPCISSKINKCKYKSRNKRRTDETFNVVVIDSPEKATFISLLKTLNMRLAEGSFNFLELEINDPTSVDMELELCKFYYKTIGKLLGRNENCSHTENMKRYLSCIPKMSRQFSDNELKTILYDRIASDKTKICSIGRGSMFDVVALVKVLELFNEKKRYLNIRVTIIDMDENWNNTCLIVLRCLEHFQKSIWKFKFICADLQKSFSDKVNSAICNADIVSMVKSFSGVKIACQEPNVNTRIFQGTNRLVKPGSLMFHLDYSENTIIQAGGGYLGNVEEFTLIYQTILNLFTVNKSVIEEHGKLYKYEFDEEPWITNLNAFCEVWHKIDLAPLQKASIKRFEGKLVVIMVRYVEQRTRYLNLNHECQQFHQTESNSFHQWKNSVKQNKTGWTKRRLQKTPYGRGIDLEKKQSMVSLISKREAACREMKKRLKQFNKVCLKWRKMIFNLYENETLEAKQQIYRQSLRKLMNCVEEKSQLNSEIKDHIIKLYESYQEGN
ncbi:hypothetical protein CEXT_22681 [Caerostris extrusa]|uniref:Uncharacterized protein n=1 Tax=Caerostris extrusa TaxID=172846 RepID=A0AAV4MGK8_CAEEX|nr:hypothetical protein CEXT_22681 [Caerostris extrusa]